MNKIMVERLSKEALKSTLSQKLASGLVKNGKIVGNVYCNCERNLIRGNFCSSNHAESRAILCFFGKNISFQRKRGWCLKGS